MPSDEDERLIAGFERGHDGPPGHQGAPGVSLPPDVAARLDRMVVDAAARDGVQLNRLYAPVGGDPARSLGAPNRTSPVEPLRYTERDFEAMRQQLRRRYGGAVLLVAFLGVCVCGIVAAVRIVPQALLALLMVCAFIAGSIVARAGARPRAQQAPQLRGPHDPG